jgi:hypothetical protein
MAYNNRESPLFLAHFGCWLALRLIFAQAFCSPGDGRSRNDNLINHLHTPPPKLVLTKPRRAGFIFGNPRAAASGESEKRPVRTPKSGRDWQIPSSEGEEVVGRNNNDGRPAGLALTLMEMTARGTYGPHACITAAHLGGQTHN